jgi:hypothetical protein
MKLAFITLTDAQRVEKVSRNDRVKKGRLKATKHEEG